MIFEKELAELFTKHQNLLAETGLSKNFIYSAVPDRSKFLIVGFNPSERKDYLQDSHSYNFKTLAEDRYFRKFYTLFKEEIDLEKVAYLDLFYQVHSKQKMIERFYCSAIGLAFLQEQLNLTKQRILALKPQLIFVFNKEAGWFFNQHPKYKIGMNFDLRKTKIEDTFEILNEPLKGCLIYFSRFLNHFVSEDEMQTIKHNVVHLIKETN